ncbi:MAG TPA: hypothetical protein VHC90_26020 [Bryobacteraceae bacterium]|nr:hypothetical protein [Bryobacteraceae bacterium]
MNLSDDRDLIRLHVQASILSLWAEELKSAMRGRFAWLGAAILLLIIGGIATAGTQDTWLDGYGIIAYGLVPLAFIPLAAGMIASARASRFVECVFTSPVKRSHWLIAKILVLLTLAAAYYLALLPMFAVYAAHVGVPLLLRKFLIWTPAMLIISVAIGVLVGVLFIGRSLAAPAGAGMGVLMFYAGLMPLQELMVARGNGASRTGHLTLASPAVLLKNALGFTLAVGSIPSSTEGAWLSLAVLTVGALALAIWIFLRAQGVETWETTRSQRWMITAALAALVIAPMTLADTNYDTPAPPANAAPVVRGLFGRGLSLTLVMPGERAPGRCCSGVLNRDSGAIGTDEESGRDLLIMLPVESGRKVQDFHAEIAGEAGLQIAADESKTTWETRAYPNELGPPAADGHHVANGWVARIPVTLDATKPWDVGGNRYPVSVHASYRIEGDPQAYTFPARAAVEGQISGVIYEMGAASLLFPALCIGAALRRWRMTR